jgi:energy-coupling factor transporter ATP-binding protein EcfA2
LLTRIVLKNFQRHARLDLPLHPVTVLWGPSGAGKSSVIRALRWLSLNDLPGDPTSFGAESCRASVYAKADRLTRFRTKSENGYKLGGAKFVALRTRGVPPAVGKALRVRPANFQGQYDGHFLLSLTPGEAGRRLNEVVNLDAIDRITAHVGAAVRQASAEVSVTETRKAEADAELERLSWVPAFAAKAGRAEATKAALAKNRLELRRIADLGRGWGVALRARDNARKGALMLRKAIAAGSAVLDCAREAAEAKELLNRLTVEEKLASVDRTKVESFIAFREKADEYCETNREVEGMIADWNDAEERLCQLNEKIAAAKRELANMPGVCPECGQAMPRPQSSALPSQTCNSGTHRRPPGRAKPTGSASRPSTSVTSPDSPKRTDVPW